jgi:DNA-binding response OmpR family regulator
MNEKAENHIDVSQLLNILIVDSKNDANQLMLFIQKMTHRALIMENSNDALNEIKVNSYDLIIVEMKLDGGIDLIKQIRKYKRDQQILAMTSESSREIEKVARDQRVIYYMIKPFDTNELKSVINHLIKRKIWALNKEKDSREPINK